MKKNVYLSLVLLFYCLYSNSQMISNTNYSADNINKKNQFGVEIGGGGTGSFTIDLGVHYIHNYTPYFAWDVIAIKASAIPDNFSKSLFPSALTGVRLTSPQSPFGLTGYLTGRIGYDYNFELDGGGLCFELGAGVNITKNIYIGYSYTHLKSSYDIEKSKTTYTHKNGKSVSKKVNYSESIDGKMNYHALRIGFYF